MLTKRQLIGLAVGVAFPLMALAWVVCSEPEMISLWRKTHVGQLFALVSGMLFVAGIGVYLAGTLQINRLLPESDPESARRHDFVVVSLSLLVLSLFFVPSAGTIVVAGMLREGIAESVHFEGDPFANPLQAPEASTDFVPGSVPPYSYN